jgi:hypothetical protein
MHGRHLFNKKSPHFKWWELQMKRSDVPQKYEYLEQSEYLRWMNEDFEKVDMETEGLRGKKVFQRE